MSYHRQTTATPKYIIFYYIHDNLLDRASVRTLYRGKNLKTEGGDSLIDEYAMTEDETDAFDMLIEKAINDVYTEVRKMTKDVTGALSVNQTVAIGEPIADIENCYAIKIKDHIAYNDNDLKMVDISIKNALTYHVLTGWYATIGLDEESKKYAFKYLEEIRDLVNKRLFGLKKPLINT